MIEGRKNLNVSFEVKLITQYFPLSLKLHEHKIVWQKRIIKEYKVISKMLT